MSSTDEHYQTMWKESMMMEEETTPIYRYDPTSRIHWLEFASNPGKEVTTLLYEQGWHWSKYRKQWYTNQRFAQVPQGIAYTDGGECQYASERAERLEARAAQASKRGRAAYNTAHSIADRIPPGQPILIGHHSERRHRRDLARIDHNMQTSIAESDKAKRLEQRAEASNAHQERAHRPDVIHRRIQRLETDLRRMQRNQKNYSDQDEFERRVSIIKQELAENKEKLEAAGGIPADHLHVEKGDIVHIGGFVARVDRINPKTYSVTIVEGGAAGSPLKLDRSELTRILRKHGEAE